MDSIVIMILMVHIITIIIFIIIQVMEFYHKIQDILHIPMILIDLLKID